MGVRRAVFYISVLVALAGCDGGTGSDAGVPDGGARDSGRMAADSGQRDAGDRDAGDRDAGSRDAGDRDASTPDVPVIEGCAILPPDSMWNTTIADAPVHERSAAYVRTMGVDTTLHPDFGTVYAGAPNGIPFTIVPGGQALVPVSFYYPDESDPGPYPIPADPRIEGGPDGDGDRHILVLETGSCTLYEVFDARPDGAGGWDCGSGAIWHLDRNERRPDAWTSADAAGLPILPGLVRYDEVMSGEVRHAIRFTVNGAQSAYIYPATHSDGRRGSDLDAPPMGLRLRLRADFDMSAFDEPIRVILRAMQRYGVVVADTGGDWFISGAPDPRWDDDMLRQLRMVRGGDFEAVYTGESMPY